MKKGLDLHHYVCYHDGMKRKRTKAEMDADERRTGRNIIGDARRDKVLQIRLTEKEHRQLMQQATKRGISAAEILMAPWRKGQEKATKPKKGGK